MLPLNWFSFNIGTIKLLHYCILSQLIILLISWSEPCAGRGGLFPVSKLAQGSSHTAGMHLFSFSSSHCGWLGLPQIIADWSTKHTVARSTLLVLLELGMKIWVPLACLGWQGLVLRYNYLKKIVLRQNWLRILPARSHLQEWTVFSFLQTFWWCSLEFIHLLEELQNKTSTKNCRILLVLKDTLAETQISFLTSTF